MNESAFFLLQIIHRIVKNLNFVLSLLLHPFVIYQLVISKTTPYEAI